MFYLKVGFIGIIGFYFPWLVALTDVLPFLNHATDYENILGYMVGSGFVFAAGAIMFLRRCS